MTKWSAARLPAERGFLTRRCRSEEEMKHRRSIRVCATRAAHPCLIVDATIVKHQIILLAATVTVNSKPAAIMTSCTTIYRGRRRYCGTLKAEAYASVLTGWDSIQGCAKVFLGFCSIIAGTNHATGVRWSRRGALKRLRVFCLDVEVGNLGRRLENDLVELS